MEPFAGLSSWSLFCFSCAARQLKEVSQLAWFPWHGKGGGVGHLVPTSGVSWFGDLVHFERPSNRWSHTLKFSTLTANVRKALG